MTLRLILGICILFLAFSIALFLPSYNSFVSLWGVFIIGVFTIISLLNSAILALMQSYMKIEFSLLSVILWKILTLLWVFFVVFVLFPINTAPDFSLGLIGIFLAGLIGILFTTFLNFLYARKKIIDFWFWYDREYMHYIFKLSLPYGIALFLGVVYFKVDIILLSLLEETSYANTSIALYALPMKIVEVLMVLGWFYLNSILPSLTSTYKENNMKDFQKLVRVSFSILFAFGVCIFSFWNLFSTHIIHIISTEQYIQNTFHSYTSVDVFGIVLAVLLFHFLSLVFIYILIALKKQSQLLYINIIVTLFNIIGNIIVIPYYSFLWAWFITVLSQILLMILWYIVVRKYIKISLDMFFIFCVIVLWGVGYIWGKILLNNYSIWYVWDVFIFWGIWGILYSGFIFLIMKKTNLLR